MVIMVHQPSQAYTICGTVSSLTGVLEFHTHLKNISFHLLVDLTSCGNAIYNNC